jgi:ribonuclease III
LVELAPLEEKLGVIFKNRDLLVTSLTHSSFVNEYPGHTSNERLEFLGDAVLGLVIAEKLYDELEQAAEGELTRRRAALVSRDMLARIARIIRLGDYLLLGKGEETTGGRGKLANLAGAMEAVIAGVYFDQGLEVARGLILRIFDEEIRKVTSATEEMDYKSKLQEYSQSRGKGTPVYHLIGESGPDHSKVFTVQVSVEGNTLATGSGKSKKLAESEAAGKALATLGEQSNIPPA